MARLSPLPLRLCIIDMNNGVENQGIRCFRGILDAFLERARESNPSLVTELTTVEARHKGGIPPDDCDLYVSSGGPGSPFDGADEPWAKGYRDFVDGLVEDGRRSTASRAMFAVCYSFELLVEHLRVARMEPRGSRKFGVMPIYTTEQGMSSPLLAPFGDRLFAFEHRNWQAVEPNEAAMRDLDAELWARESRDGHSKGPSLLAFRFAPNIEGTLFHPEADRAGALAWIARPDQAAAVIQAYGELTYVRMLKTLDDPMRLARTRALMVPGWLTRRFNALAEERGWRTLAMPTYDRRAASDYGSMPYQTELAAGVGVEVPEEGI